MAANTENKETTLATANVGSNTLQKFMLGSALAYGLYKLYKNRKKGKK